MSDRITEAQIRALVFSFYGAIREDPTLGPVFEARLSGRWEPHLEKMCDFWSSVLLASRRFTGNPAAAHVGLPGLQPEHFDRWLDLFHRTATALLPPHVAADVVGRAQRMRIPLERAAFPGAHEHEWGAPRSRVGTP
ncbi:MAG: group III truncated hemoglobin [Gemmatimonadota bacterium]